MMPKLRSGMSITDPDTLMSIDKGENLVDLYPHTKGAIENIPNLYEYK